MIYCEKVRLVSLKRGKKLDTDVLVLYLGEDTEDVQCRVSLISVLEALDIINECS